MNLNRVVSHGIEALTSRHALYGLLIVMRRHSRFKLVSTEVVVRAIIISKLSKWTLVLDRNT